MPLRASWTGVSSSIDIAADGRVVGKIPVPPDAVLWNAQDQKWESGLVYADLKGNGTGFGYRKTGRNHRLLPGHIHVQVRKMAPRPAGGHQRLPLRPGPAV